MPIKIENISEDYYVAPNVYSVRINDDLVACFTHDRELGLAECLRAAARACEGMKEKKEQPNGFKSIAGEHTWPARTA